MDFLRFVILPAVLVTLLWADSSAQSITGTVQDAVTREPLVGATVLLRKLADEQEIGGTATDRQGRFQFNDISVSDVILEVSFVGYQTLRQVFHLSPESRASISLSLEPEAFGLPEVILTHTRARRQINPITISNLSVRDIEERGTIRDLPVLLSETPSITYHSENGNGIGYSTLRMRGFDQRRVAVLINGIPQNDPEAHNVFWINFFDVQGAVDDVQIQRGAGSAFYGSAGIAGAINIRALPYRPEPHVMAQIGYGSFNTQRYTIEANSGLLNDRYVLYGRFSRLLSDGYRAWSWTEFYRFFAGIVRYGERSTLTLQSYGGPQRDGLAFSGISRSANSDEDERRFNFSSLTEDVENFHQPHVELLHDLEIRPDLSFHQSLFWVKGEGYFDFGGTFRSADYLRLPDGFRGLSGAQRQLPLFLTAPDVNLQFRAYLDQHQFGWLPRITQKHSSGETTIGGEARLHRSLRWGRVQEAVGIPDDLVGPEKDARVYQFKGEKIVASGFVHHLFRPVAWLAMQADAQVTYQHYRHYDESFFRHEFKVPYLFLNPRVGLTVYPGRPLSFYGSLALANREPRLKALYDGEEAGDGFLPQFERNSEGSLDFGRPLVKPEQLLNTELGVAYRQSNMSLAANLFLMSFKDEIVPSGGLDQFGVPRSGNAERTLHRGIEVEGALQPLRAVELSGNLTLSRNRIVRFTEYLTNPDLTVHAVDRSGNPIAGFPEVVANVRAVYRFSGASVSLAMQHAGRQFIDNSGGKLPDGSPSPELAVPPYTLVNASVIYDLPVANGIRLTLDVNNVLNDKVLLFGNVGPAGPQFFPAATRNVFGSIRYRLN